MTKRLGFFLIFVWLAAVSVAQAQPSVKVLILPFSVNAQEDMNYLASEIPQVLAKHLETDGAVLVTPAEIPQDLKAQPDLNIDAVRAFGREYQADYVTWGALTWIGQQYSLDTRLLNVAEVSAPDAIYTVGDKVENLPKSIKSLAGEVGSRIFKREKVADVLIQGNQRIEADAIRKVIKTAPGDVMLAKSLSRDLKAVYAMGYFDDIRIESEEGDQGKVIVFHVTEKATIRNIILEGNDEYDDDEILEVLDLKTGSILNVSKVQNNVHHIEDLYTDKKYHNVEVTYAIEEMKNNQANLRFTIVEGEPLSVTNIVFDGNAAFTSKELRGLMKVSEKGMFSWMTSSGELNSEDLEQDTLKIAAFYQNQGFIQVKISDAVVEYLEEGISITIKIDEGPQFRVGTVDINGDLARPRDVLIEQLNLPQEAFFNREVMRNDVLMLADIYSDEGFAFADIDPQMSEDLENRVVNIVYEIVKGKPVYFEKIIITGNTKTRDKVIRRELKVYEQELFSGRRLKQGIQNLYRLDFFEDIQVDTVKGSADDQMVLKVNVTEKATGTFSLGGGYSSVETFFVSGSVAQRNLFGRGQELRFKAEFGGRTDRFDISFTEPWLFDIPLSAGIDLFTWDRDYDSYDKESTGGALRFGYRVYDFTRLYLSYVYSLDDVSNISPTAADSIQELEGENTTSAVSSSLVYDSRDQVFNPTRGQDHRLTIEYAGLGGTINFIKYLAELGFYVPLYKSLVGFAHGIGGYVEPHSGGLLPDYERFYLGGPNSMRGFDWRGISATDEDGNEIGGNSYMMLNLELIFPLIKDAGVMGVVFYDTGNVWAEDSGVDLGDLRQDAGGGIRWYSPMGPIRLEYGYILDPEPGGESGGRWQFAMGTAF